MVWKIRRKVIMGYRDNINKLINNGDLIPLLEKSAEFHGHICSLSAFGVKAGSYAVKYLGQYNQGMEEVVAIVETNNCFSDGIQLVTGCTFGNNALIFKDMGKTAFTLASRKNNKAIRLSLKKEYWESRKKAYPEVSALFEKIVSRREKVPSEQKKRFFSLAEEMARKEIQAVDEDVFDIKRLEIDVPRYAPIYDSVVCNICSESIMETRAGIKDGKPACIDCASSSYFYMDGFGISHKRGNR